MVQKRGFSHGALRRLAQRMGWRIALLVALPLVLAQAAPVRAVTPTYTVNTPLDGLNAGACAAATPGRCTLREAIQEGNTAGGATITVPGGGYTLTIAPSGPDDNTTGDLNVTAPLTINGAGATSTFVQASKRMGSGIDRVFSIDSTGLVTITGMTIRNGKTVAASDNCCDGGGILVVGDSSGALTLTGVTLIDNTAVGVNICATASVSQCFSPSQAPASLAQGNSTPTRAALRAAVRAAHSTKGAGGQAVPRQEGGVSGGGLAADGTGAVTLTHVTISSNTATSAGLSAAGGGIAENAGSTFTLNDDVIVSNTATDTATSTQDCNLTPFCDEATGGGIAENGGGSFTLTNVTISGNRVTTMSGSNFSAGGGIDEEGDGAVSLTNVTVNNNTITAAAGFAAGGGIDEDFAAVNMLSSVLISGNTVSNDGNFGGGGGIEADGGGSFNLTNVAVINNSVFNKGIAVMGDAFGGGIDEEFGDTVTLNAVTVSGNQVNDVKNTSGGGGITGFGHGTITITNATIANNSTNGTGAEGGGGGIGNISDGITLVSVTLSGNSSPKGANIFELAGDGGSTSLKGTILANPSQSANCSGAVISNGDNLSSDTSCNLTMTGDQQGKNPNLGSLADNGGPTIGNPPTTSPTLTEGLMSGSPAIDADPNGCPPPATDERGVTRPQGSACDIGAFEGVLASSSGTPPTKTCNTVNPRAGSSVFCTITLQSAVAAGGTVTDTVTSPFNAKISACFPGTTPGVSCVTGPGFDTATVNCTSACAVGTQFSVVITSSAPGPLVEQVTLTPPAGGGSAQSFTVTPNPPVVFQPGIH